MISSDPRKPAAVPPTWGPFFALCLGLVATAAVALYVRRTSDSKDRARLTAAVRSTRAAIRDRMEVYTNVLRGASGLFAVDPAVSRRQFHAYVDRLDIAARYPGIQGIGFSRRIARREESAVVDAMRRQGVPQFRIWPGGRRPEYHAILYLEPMDARNQRAIGFDMATEAQRRAAMDQARDTGLPAASGRVTLVQETARGRQAGFLVYLPIYRTGRPPSTIAGRREALLGYVYSPFRADDLLNAIFPSEARPEVDFALYDGPEVTPGHLLHRSGHIDPAARDHLRQIIVPVDVAGRQWRLVMAPRAGFIAASESALAGYVVLAGLVISVLLFGITWTEARARVQGERIAADLRLSEGAHREAYQTLQALIQACPLGIQVLELDGTVRMWNPAAHAMLGWTEAEVVGHSLPSVPEDRRQEFRDYLADVAAGRTLVGVETRRLRKDGTTIDLALWTTPLTDACGGVRCMTIFADITDRRKAAEKDRFLSAASELLASSLDYPATLDRVAHLAVPILADWCAIDTLEPDGTVRCMAVVHADPKKEELARDLRGRYPPRPDDPHGVMKVLRTGESVLAADIPDSLLAQAIPDLDLLRIVRELSPRSAIIAPLQARGRILGALTLVLAESERRYGPDDLALAEDLARRAGIAMDNARLFAEIQEADRRKDEFLATLAHELRNPLAPILNASHLIGLTAEDPVLRHTQEILDRQVRHMARLVDDLLDVSRITRDTIDLRVQPVDLSSVLDEAIQTSRPRIDARRHRLTVSRPREPIPVAADSTRLVQVFANLLNNAAKYTEPGGHIDILVAAEAGEAVVRVKDTGIGIRPEMLPKVFDLFTQIDPTIDRSHGGLGIGLTLVRRLVEKHGGRVEAHSAGAGQGSEFIVRLPRSGPDSAEAPGPQEPEEHDGQPGHADDAEGAGGRRGAPPAPRARHILVVDDNRDGADMLAEVLRIAGHDVRTAYDGPSALQAAQADPPEVLLLDIGLPRMDGYEVAARLRSEPLFDRTMIVALTGFGQEVDRQRSRDAGFDHHLTKPVDSEALLGLISKPSGSFDQHPSP